MRDRSIRRHHKERMKANANNVWQTCWGNDEPADEKHVGRLADNLKICSCYMCGNPRRHFEKRTRQELKAELE